MNTTPTLMQRWAAAAAIVLLAVALPTLAAAPHPDCDEACLKSMMDGYLQALQKHDPSGLPLAPNVRFTENGVAIPLGEALWVTISGLGRYRHDFFDPASGGVASYVTMRENGTPGYLMVRLKVIARRLTQIETVVNRDAPPSLTQPAYEPLWDQIEPKAQRLTRSQLIAGTCRLHAGRGADEGRARAIR